MAELQGIISDITFQNEDSGFTVAKLQCGEQGVLYTCVGVMPTISRGESISVQGEWESHKRFGKQFSVRSYQIVRPTTLQGIAMLLGSGMITSIGPVRSGVILEKFGIDTLDILDKEPDRLLEVSGIGPKMLAKIKESWDRQRHLRSLMMFLQEYGVTVNMALKIYKIYGPEAQAKISENPYKLIDDIWGVGFVKADRIARNMGFPHDSYKRIRAGLTFVMQEAASEGHCYLPLEQIQKKASELLDVEEEKVTFSLDHAVEIKYLIKDENCIYLPIHYYAEKFIASDLRGRLTGAMQARPKQSELIGRWLEEYGRKSGWLGDKKQLEAIRAAILNPLLLLTGGPGTGKTTILQVIVSYFREHNRVVLLTAPTGRAAQRMGSVAGLTAKTLHRLLEFKPGTDGFSFQKNEKNPIEADVIIVDEVSMIDVLLMRHFLSAIKPGTQLILVGDENQLPSVGAGNVLADLISSCQILHIHLTTIFRQAAASRIITAAHEIICGNVPAFSNTKQDDCFFLTEPDPEGCAEKIVDLVTRRLPARYQFDPVTDIQVLSPMHKGTLGTENLNAILQKKLSKGTRCVERGQIRFFVGDKVMQVRNNYDLGVFNGDIGIVSEIVDEDGLRVDFVGNQIEYTGRDIEELVAAYCISIHKSQGCEFKAVVIPTSTQHFIMLQRNLIYTALTRARCLCVFVGTHNALNIAVKNNQAFLRYSRLAQRLRQLCLGTA